MHVVVTPTEGSKIGPYKKMKKDNWGKGTKMFLCICIENSRKTTTEGLKIEINVVKTPHEKYIFKGH